MDKIKIGDEVMWRGAWGSQPARPARIESMELCELPRMKYGVSVTEAFASDKDRLCVSLTNGSWAYGFQIEPIKTKE